MTHPLVAIGLLAEGDFMKSSPSATPAMSNTVATSAATVRATESGPLMDHPARWARCLPRWRATMFGLRTIVRSFLVNIVPSLARVFRITSSGHPERGGDIGPLPTQVRLHLSRDVAVHGAATDCAALKEIRQPELLGHR